MLISRLTIELSKTRMKTTLSLLFMVTTIFVISDAFWLPPPTPHLMKSRSDIVKIKDMDILLQKDLRKIIKAMLDDSLARRTNPIQAPLVVTTGMFPKFLSNWL